MSLIDDDVDRVLNKEKIIETIITDDSNSLYSLDAIQEQMEAPMTTIYCPESIKEDELKFIEKKPNDYIEINFIKKVPFVDNFYIHSNIKEFHYKDKLYSIVEEDIYILPTKKGFFIPTCFFKEDELDSVNFKQKNTGIPGKSLSLLYDVALYEDLFSGDENKYNLFIVIFLLGSIICFLVGLYFVLGGTI